MSKKAWLISVNMGYGHQRTAFALLDLAIGGKNINANDYGGIPSKDRRTWETMKKGYEAVSSFKRFPLIGNLAFSIMDYFQRIMSFYPARDLSRPNFQLKQTISMIKNGLGRDLIEKLKASAFVKASADKQNSNKYPPIISTFFTPAFMAEIFQYPGDIYCIVCDADISRTWAPLNPKQSKIKYFAPTERVVERLKLYGINENNIFFTGYPLPKENTGNRQMDFLKRDLKSRLLNLDPQKRYFGRYKILIEKKIGELSQSSDHPLTLMFAVGGAGAQKEIGAKVLKNLAEEIKGKRIKLILAAGIREKVKKYFEENIARLLSDDVKIEIIFGKNIENYFKNFNSALRKTDILWTKPSELSFYSALGLPIIIAPPIGSQEEFNKRWLLKSGFGLAQENPNYVKEWLFDWIESGYLAEAAMQGFIEGQQMGAYNIKKILSGHFVPAKKRPSDNL